MMKTRMDQVAALPWRQGEQGVEVMLITSRETRRWVIPKGGLMNGKTEAQAAAQEAYEEAGVQGELSERPLGHFSYDKRLKSGQMLPTRVAVYPLEVLIQLGSFPEVGQRDLCWMTRSEAAEKVNEADLADLIRNFSPMAD